MWYQLAADRDMNAQYYFGTIYADVQVWQRRRRGSEVVPIGGGGHADAQVSLGFMYANGCGVAKR